MHRHTILKGSVVLLLFLGSACAQNVTKACNPSLGPCFDAEVFRKNLRYLSGTVLPEGWKLNTVVKWEGYGSGLKDAAAVAAQEGHSVGVLYKDEVEAAASITPRPEIFRMFPANYSDLVAAIQAGYKTQELASPINIADLLQAGKDTNTTIPIHIYLYKHYDDSWGWNFTTPQQLQTFVDLLDKRYVKVVGVMMHLNGYPDDQKMPLSQQFLQVACPVAASLAPQKIAVHWVNSDEALELIPKPNKRYGNYRMQPVIPAVCNASNIEYWARMGTAIYGSYVENYADPAEGSGPGTAPVLRWTSKVKQVGQTPLSSGAVRRVAVADLSPARYPSPSWWSNAEVFNLANATAFADGEEEADEEEGDDEDAAPGVKASAGPAAAAAATEDAPDAAADDDDDADTAQNDNGEEEGGDADDNAANASAPDPYGRPRLFVYIKGQMLQLADLPAANGTMILVDVTDAEDPVAPGDEVCLLCEDHPVGTFGMEVGADEYNMALCLKGLGATPGEATEYDDPNCIPWAKVQQ